MQINIGDPIVVDSPIVLKYTATDNNCVIQITDELGNVETIVSGNSLTITTSGTYTSVEVNPTDANCTCSGELHQFDDISSAAAGDADPISESYPIQVCSLDDPPVKILIHSRYEDGIFIGYFDSDEIELVEGTDFIICKEEVISPTRCIVEDYIDSTPSEGCGIIPTNQENYVAFADVTDSTTGLYRYDDSVPSYSAVASTRTPFAAPPLGLSTFADALFRNYITGTVDWFRKSYTDTPTPNYASVRHYQYNPDTDVVTDLGELNATINGWEIHGIDAAIGLPSTENNENCSILIGAVRTRDPDNVAIRLEPGIYSFDPVTLVSSQVLDFDTHPDAVALGITNISDINVRADGKILIVSQGGGAGENVYLTDESFSTITLLMTSGVFTNSGMVVEGNTLVFIGTDGVVERWTDQGVFIDSTTTTDVGAPYDGTHSPIQPFGGVGEEVAVKKISCYSCDGSYCEEYFNAETGEVHTPVNLQKVEDPVIPLGKNCYDEDVSLTSDRCLLDEVKGLRSDLSTSQSAIETAITSQTTAITTAVNNAASTIVTAIEDQTDELTVEIESVVTAIEDLQTEVEAGNATLGDIVTELEAILAVLESGDIVVNVDLSPITDAISTFQTTMSNLLTITNSSISDIVDNTDDIESLVGDLIVDVQAGNVTLASIVSGVSDLLVELQALNTTSSNLEILLQDILFAIGSVDHTDDDLRPIAPRCYFDVVNDTQVFGYFTTDELGANATFVPIPDYTECIKTSPILDQRELCVDYYVDDGNGGVIAEKRIAVGIYEITSDTTTLLRVESRQGTELTEGTAMDEYEVVDGNDCDCDTPFV